MALPFLSSSLRTLLGSSNSLKGLMPLGVLVSFFYYLSYTNCRWGDSNSRPTDYESVALPPELHRQKPLFNFIRWQSKLYFHLLVPFHSTGELHRQKPLFNFIRWQSKLYFHLLVPFHSTGELHRHTIPI